MLRKVDRENKSDEDYTKINGRIINIIFSTRLILSLIKRRVRRPLVEFPLL